MAALYIDFDKAKVLSGISDTLTTAIKDAIVEWVENLKIKLLLGTDFNSKVISTSNPELYSIKDFQDSIVLKNFPIISVTRLRDNIRATSPTTLVENTDFVIDKATGTIYIIKNEDNITNGTLDVSGYYFTSGINTVDIAYVYGWSAIPDDVKSFATVYASKILRMWSKFANTGDVESFTMGDYSEKVGQWSKVVDSQFDPIINESIIALKSKYKNYITLGASFKR